MAEKATGRALGQAVAGVFKSEDVDVEGAGYDVGVYDAVAEVLGVCVGVDDDVLGLGTADEGAGDAEIESSLKPEEVCGVDGGKTVFIGDNVLDSALCALVGAELGGTEDEMGVELAHVVGGFGE